MNWLPQAVLVALKLCDSHATMWGSGAVWVDPKDPNIVSGDNGITQSVMGPVMWSPGYESCAKIESLAVAIVSAHEQEERDRADAEQDRQLRAHAKRDQPALQAALDALRVKR